MVFKKCHLKRNYDMPIYLDGFQKGYVFLNKLVLQNIEKAN